MDPMLSWVVCLLSAFLLAAGGFLFARAASSRRLASRAGDITRLSETLKKLLEERKVHQARERELMNRLDGAERALGANLGVNLDDDGFGGHTELPDPKPYFERDSVPHLQRVSDDEFEIPDAAPRSAKEAFREAEPNDGLDGHDETRQFNLHSPENVVQFMQRIDELAEENSELRSTVTEHEKTIKERRAEGNEQIHRFAALDATAEKLRSELKRRNERIKFLEGQLKEQLANDDGPLTNPLTPPETPAVGAVPPRVPSESLPPPRTPSGSLPPPRTRSGSLPPPRTRSGNLPMAPAPSGSVPPSPPPAAFSVGSSALKITGPHDGPTLQVRKVSPEELESDDK